MEHNRHNLLLFWACFCPFPPLTTQKIKILKKWKNTWRYHNFTVVYQKWQSYDVWFLRYGVLLRFLSFWTIFCSFNSLRTQKIKILKTMKKHPGDIIILHMCIINENLMMYRSWDMEHDRHIFLSFWTIFCPFTPLNQNFEKMKEHLEISSFYKSVPKITIICSTVSVT